MLRFKVFVLQLVLLLHSASSLVQFIIDVLTTIVIIATIFDSISNMGGVSSAKVTVADLANISLKIIRSGDSFDPFPASNLWKDRTTLIFIVRRTGCPLCREQAQLLVTRSKDFASLGIPMTAVIHEIIQEDVDGFQQYFGGNPIYHDSTRGFYNAQGNRWAGLHSLLFPSVIAAISRASSKKIDGNTRGEGRLLGGLLIVSPEKGVIYEQREEWFGDHADVDEVLKACGFHDDDVKRMERQGDADNRPPAEMPSAGTSGCK